MLLSIDFGSVFISIPLDISDIEAEEDSDIDGLKNLNVDVQMHLVFEEEYEEFTVIRVNFNIVKNDSEEYLYDENNLYFESNNVGYNDII